MTEGSDENGAAQEIFTILEVLGAHVSRSRFRALKLDANGNCNLHVAVGIRRLLDPPLADGYYGNAFISANVISSGRDLIEGSLSKLVKPIKQSKRQASSKDYIARSLSNIEKIRELNVKVEGPTGASIVLTDWRHLGLLEDVDFGWKESVNLVLIPSNMPWFVDVCVFMSPPKLDKAMRGGVRVSVSLLKAAMANFREEMHALTHGVDATAT